MPKPITLTMNEAPALAEALDSYMYWKLADEKYRSDGFVMDPGSDDAVDAEGIATCQEAIDWCNGMKAPSVLPEAVRGLARAAATFYLDEDPDEYLAEDTTLRPTLEALLAQL
jgi:hypothetical protein